MSEPTAGIRYLVLFRREELQVIRRDLERLESMGNWKAGLSRNAALNRIRSEIKAIDDGDRLWFDGRPRDYKPMGTVTGDAEWPGDEPAIKTEMQ